MDRTMTLHVKDILTNEQNATMEVLAIWDEYYIVRQSGSGNVKALKYNEIRNKGYKHEEEHIHDEDCDHKSPHSGLCKQCGKNWINCPHPFYEKKEEKPWPGYGDMYWYADDSGNVEEMVWDDCEVDKYRLSIGNCHRNKAGAEAYRDSLKPQSFRNTSLKSLLEECDFTYINSNITEKNFPVESANKNVEVVLIDKKQNTEEVLEILKKKNMRPANLTELLYWWTAHPEKHNGCLVAALGSVWGGLAPYVSGLGAYRYLSLSTLAGGWGSDHAFAAVSK